LAAFTTALGSNESVSEFDDAEEALKAALHHLRHLSRAWKKVLSRNVYHIAMGNLVDTIFVLFLEPVLKASEISDPASRFVHYLFLEAVKSSVEVFRTDDNCVENEEVLLKVAAKHAVEFEKVQAVGQFMLMRLDDVQRGLEEGKFRCVKAKELSHLIAATFDESEKRRSLLNSLIRS
jgi:centromere/kinetochore protein ZW10